MLGIIILNYKTWQLTVNCVDTLKNSLYIDYKIFIVDNASPNNSYENIQKVFQNDKNVVCIRAKENGGYAKGNNIGVNACIQEGIKYALITNNDVEFQMNAIFHMMETIMHNQNTVIVSPKILSRTGQVNSIPYYGPQTLGQYLGIKRAAKLHVDAANISETTKVYSVPGSCMMVDIDKFKKMGAFDTGTFMYCEEGTVSKQAWHAGYDILFEPKSVVIHNHGASTGLRNVFIESNVLCSSLYYWRKYENVPDYKLYIIYYFFTIKMLIKIIFRRINGKGLFSALTQCRKKLRQVLLIERRK